MVFGEGGVGTDVSHDFIEEVLFGNVLVLAQILHADVKLVEAVGPLQRNLKLDALVLKESTHV